MSEHPRDPWRLPSIDAFGAQLRERENRDHATWLAREERKRRRSPLRPGAALAAVLAALLFLVSGGPASAISIINRAPAAAIRSVSVAYRSVINVALGGQPRAQFAQHGQVDFATGDYTTTLTSKRAGADQERRVVDGVLYIAAHGYNRLSARASGWTAVQLNRNQRSALASAPESDALTDPLALLRLLGNLKAPAHRIGHGTIEGASVTDYRVASDLAALLQASAPGTPTPADYRSVRATLGVWLDHAGRPRRVTERLSAPSTSGLVALEDTTTYSRYGEPLRVEAPTGVQINPEFRGGLPVPLVRAPSRIFEILLRSGGH